MEEKQVDCELLIFGYNSIVFVNISMMCLLDCLGFTVPDEKNYRMVGIVNEVSTNLLEEFIIGNCNA